MGDTLNLEQLIGIVKKRCKVIISITVFFTLLGWILAIYILNPIYESSRQIVVNNTKSNINQQPDYNTVMTNFQYNNTYSDIIYSEFVLEKVMKDLNLKKTVEEFSKQITVISKKDSQIITITVKDADYRLAVRIVNKLAIVFKDQAIDILKVDNIELFPPTEVKDNPKPIAPKPVLIIIATLMAGLVLGLATSLLLEVLDNTITKEKDLEETLEIPVIGTISTVLPKDLEKPDKLDGDGERVKLRSNRRAGGRVS